MRADTDRLDRSRFAIEFEDTFEADRLDERRWLPFYLPQWASRAATAARFDVGGGRLRLRIDADQPPWSPEWNGGIRVSNLQTGVRSGPVGSRSGQHPFRPDLVVREEQAPIGLYTPQYGLIEVTARAIADPANLVALWLIGVEDEPARSGEICVMEIFGRDVEPDGVRVGMGIHPFGDPALRDDFEQVRLAIDATEPHTYSAEWMPDRVAFYVDDRHVRTVRQSPAYPMQLMLNVYEFADGDKLPSPPERYPKVFEVFAVRGWRPVP
jgi:hypothetical protein